MRVRAKTYREQAASTEDPDARHVLEAAEDWEALADLRDKVRQEEHSASYCRRMAETLAAQARDPQLPPRKRAALEQLSISWATCAKVRDALDEHEQQPASKVSRDGASGFTPRHRS
jgi:hypothetical protein